MVYLEEILVHDDFAKAVRALGQPFIREAGLGPVHQLGIVVPNAEAASHRLEQKGIKPFFIATGSVDYWTENGKDRAFKGTVASSVYQGVELELLEPGDGSNFYRKALDSSGRMVVHHLGFVVPDVDEASEMLTEKGCSLWVRGRLGQKPWVAEFAYMDAIAQCGFVVEFISHSMFGKRMKGPQGLMGLLGKVQKKAGKRIWRAK